MTERLETSGQMSLQIAMDSSYAILLQKILVYSDSSPEMLSICNLEWLVCIPSQLLLGGFAMSFF